MTKNKTTISKEQALIQSIKKWINVKHDACVVGIGDDTAVVPWHAHNMLVSTDALVENIHFTRKTSSWYEIGWKSLAVNVSDIAAMGGVPKYALISFALTKDMTQKNLHDFYRGFKALAEKTGVQLIGGDTVASKKDAMISVTIIGACADKKAVLRRGAQPGDLICVTGTLGDAAYGLAQLLRGKKNSHGAQKLRQPMPRWKEGKQLASIATSMMDTSDGFSTCIHEMMHQSHTGCEIVFDLLPVSPLLKKHTGKKSIEYALYGGEDYELVFTIPPHKKHLLKNIPHTIVGKVTQKKCYLIFPDGKKTAFPQKGYDALAT